MKMLPPSVPASVPALLGSASVPIGSAQFPRGFRAVPAHRFPATHPIGVGPERVGAEFNRNDTPDSEVLNIASPPASARTFEANPGGFSTDLGTQWAQRPVSICEVMSYNVGLLLGQKSRGYENAYCTS